jgi:hypothetical protein
MSIQVVLHGGTLQGKGFGKWFDMKNLLWY